LKSKKVSGLKPLINDFDLFLIDQYGVLHNGNEPYPGAVETLKKLKLLNKRVVIISNSGKRASVNISRLATLGFNDSLFDNVITSGEVAFNRLQSRLHGSSTKLCYLIARDKDLSAITGLDLGLAEDAASADLILISASEAERYSEDAYREQLRDAAKHNIPCVCTNPDKKMLTSTGLQFGAGRIAEIYEELGGLVEWIGKPYPAIYQNILNLHGDCKKERILCIGDSIEHDIAGGQGVNLKSLLVMTGINTGLTMDELQSQFRQYNTTPAYIAARLAF